MILVAAYCRVSTNQEDQNNSFQSQQRYFREYIARQPEWKLFRVYADEGITGTSTRKRREFNRMIHDGFCGSFQLILTKEVSRFSRNILDTIAYTRQLKARGIGVVFLTDGFCTLDPDAELRLSIMGSLAQEESRKTSARVKWGQTRQMEKGVVFGRSMLGYDIRNGVMTVNPSGAKVIRRIFYLYGVEKLGTTGIAKLLEQEGIPTYTGQSHWTGSRVLKILKNEKYAGDLIQKKTFTPDYLTHDKKYNHGQEPMVIHRNHHEPIVSRELWNLVQKEIHLRSRQEGQKLAGRGDALFSGKIRCGLCGGSYVCRRKTRRDGSVYMFWRCIRAVRFGAESPGGCQIGKTLSDSRAKEILCSLVRNLPIDRRALIQRVTRLARDAEATVKGRAEPPRSDSRKLESAVRGYLAGSLTEDDLIRIRAELEADQCTQQPDEYEPTDFPAILDAMFRCDPPSDIFLKQLLEGMTVYPDGTVTVKLYHQPEYRVSK